MKTRLAAALLGAALALSACGGGNETTSGDRTDTTPADIATTTTDAPSATTTTTAEPETAGGIDDDSRLSFEGIGPVRAGMTMEEAERAAAVPMRRSELPACIALAPSGEPQGVDLIFPGSGPLEFVFAREGSRIRTESGIALGDEEAAVLRAHPDADVTNPGQEVHRVVVRESDKGRRLLFEIERGRVSVMWSGPNGSEMADEICS